MQAAERGDEAEFVAAAAEILGPRPDMFCTTTGTTGACKLIPLHPQRLAASHKVRAAGDRAC